MIVDDRNTRLFRHITNRNLLWQYDFLIDSIRIGLPRRRKLDHYVIRALNFFAVVNLCDDPGTIRSDDVYIEGATHDPPGHHEVRAYYHEFIPDLHRRWDTLDSLHVAAFVVWKINWIHPFTEGNGRTARAAMYYALSIKEGRLLAGENSIPAQIRANSAPYYRILKATDLSFKATGVPDLDPMATYLGRLLDRQLES
jgi:Fic family protein